MEYLVLNNNTIAPACIPYIGTGCPDDMPSCTYRPPCDYNPCPSRGCYPKFGPTEK